MLKTKVINFFKICLWVGIVTTLLYTAMNSVSKARPMTYEEFHNENMKNMVVEKCYLGVSTNTSPIYE